GIAYVHVGPPELLAVDDEAAVERRVARELVHGQVEAHPRRGAVDRREAEAARLHAVHVVREHLVLRGHLRLGVQRDRTELELLLAESEEQRGDAAVDEGIQDADRAAAVEELVDDDRPEIAGAARDKCPSGHRDRPPFSSAGSAERRTRPGRADTAY